MNFVTGVVIMAVLYAPAAGFRAEFYGGPLEGYGTEDCGLLAGDRFLAVDGHRVLVYGNARFSWTGRERPSTLWWNGTASGWS